MQLKLEGMAVDEEERINDPELLAEVKWIILRMVFPFGMYVCVCL